VLRVTGGPTIKEIKNFIILKKRSKSNKRVIIALKTYKSLKAKSKKLAK